MRAHTGAPGSSESHTQAADRPREAVRTIADLARLAGVSGATVSRALRDSPLVKKETRARIQELARQHRFRLNTRARQLRLQRTDTIAVYLLIGEGAGQPLSDPFLLELIGVIGDELAAAGYDLLLSRAAPGSRWWEELLHPHRFDGAIIFGQAGDHPRLNALADKAVPFVVWGGALSDRRYDLVGSDNVAGGEAATAHLIEEGCRRIAFLGERGFPEVALRWEGYVNAHRRAGLAIDPTLSHAAAFTAEGGAAGVRDLLAAGKHFDGIVAASDMIAVGAVNALEEAGLVVPRDVAVTGFDDVPLASHLRPALTTVRQDVVKGGRLLVDILRRRLAGERTGEPQAALLPVTLVVRESSRRKARGPAA